MAHSNHASLAEYKAALDASGDLIAIVDRDHIYRMVNRAFLEKRGVPQEHVLGCHVQDVLGPRQYAQARPHLEKSFAGHEVDYVMDVAYPRQGVRIMRVRYTPVWGEDVAAKQVERVLSVIQDITPLREAEALSRRHEATYAKLFLESHAVMLLVDPVSGLIIDTNRACCDFYGQSQEELCLFPFEALEAPACKGGMSKALKADKDHYVCCHRIAHGEVREVEIFVTSFVPDTRNLLHLTIYDVTEEMRQKKHKAFLASIVESTHDAVIGKDKEGRVLSWNKSAQAMYGYTEDEIIGKSINTIIPAELRDEIEGLMAAALAGETVDKYETRRLRKDGSEIDVSLIISPIQDANGSVLGLSTIARDITERKQVERRLHVLAAIVQQAEEAFVITDQNGRMEYVNAAFSSYSGIEENNARGMQVQNVLHPVEMPGVVDATKTTDWREALYAGRSWSGRLAIHGAKKGKIVFYARLLPLTTPNDQTAIRVLTLRDVRREESLEQQLRQAQKMEALGTLASGIAHDFNNVLASIMVNAETAALLAAELPKILLDCLDDIGSSSRRGAELVKNILTFCRQGEQELQPMELQPVVKEALKLLRSTLPADVALKPRVDAAGCMAIVDPSQIHQVIMNLCLNSVQAMPEGGELRVDLDLGEKDTVVLRVADQGTGIAPEHLQRVCDPFFTTKRPGEGTGLGLSIVHGIISTCGGALHIESTPGEGSVITVSLPLHKGEFCPPDAGDKTPAPGKGVLLVVDDDAGVLVSLERGLGQLGYEVLVAKSGSEAVAVYERERQRIDLLLCDHAMPGMAGVQLAGVLRATTPALPVIFYTGDTGALEPEALFHLNPCAVLHKPLSIIQISKTIQEMLPQKG